MKKRLIFIDSTILVCGLWFTQKSHRTGGRIFAPQYFFRLILPSELLAQMKALEVDPSPN